MIPFKRVIYSENTKKEVNKLLDSGFVGLGKYVGMFEKRLADYVGGKYCLAVDSCTSAIFLSAKYSSSGSFKIPSMTVPLVADAILEAGRLLYFDERTDWVGDAYSIVPDNSIYDSAHELERDMLFGKKNYIYCYSFYPTKNIGSADGGAIVSDNEDFIGWARRASTYGRDEKGEYKNSWDYDVVLKGYKRHYTNLQAAICNTQLDELDDMNAKRIYIRNKYNDAFNLRNRSLYLYRINVHDRDAFIEKAYDAGIECGVHFKPLHLMKAFEDISFLDDGDRVLVEKAYKSTVSLPFYWSMDEKDVDFIIKFVKDWGLHNNVKN